MNVLILFAAVAVALGVWCLLLQRFTAKPWLTTGIDTGETHRFSRQVSAKLGFWVFLAVITSLFALFSVAYNMRMGMADWRPLAEPRVLWLNTGCLILSSIVMQFASAAARRGEGSRRHVVAGMLGGGVLAFAFIGGQLWAWTQLLNSGYTARANPANAFFYLMTAVHGLHLLGGLWVWSRATIKLLMGAAVERVRVSVELCTQYWHYLLLVWFLLFALLLGT